MSKYRNHGTRLSPSWKTNEIYTDKEEEQMKTFDEEYEDWLSKEPIKKPIQIDTEAFFDDIMAICKDYEDRHPEAVKPIDAKRQAIEMILHNHYDYVNSEAVNDLYRLPSFTEEKLS